MTTSANAFARLEDWRGAAIRYDRCGGIVLSVVTLAATAIFQLWVNKTP